MNRLTLILCLAATLASAQLPPLTPQTILGTRMSLPDGWKVTPQQSGDQLMVVAQADPSRPNAPTLGLLGIKVDPARAAATTPAQWSKVALDKLLGGKSPQAALLNETPKANTVFHLYRLDDASGRNNLSSFASVNTKTGVLLYLFFSAPEQQFAALSGPVLPLLAFAGLSPAVAEKVSLTPADRQRLGGLQAQILELDKRARQKILFAPTGGGWCLQGQPGCQ